MNTPLNRTTQIVWLIGALIFAMIGAAAAPSTTPCDKSDQQPHHEPPAQAYQDCKGKQAGDVVQITTPREGNISATCTESPKGLFARPEHPPRDQDEPGKNQSK